MNGPANKDDGAQDSIDTNVPAGIVLAVGTGTVFIILFLGICIPCIRDRHRKRILAAMDASNLENLKNAIRKFLVTTTVISNCEICSIEQRNHDEPPLEIPCTSCCLVGDIGTSSHSLRNSQRNVSQAVELIDYDYSDDNNKRPAGITCSICLECFGVGNKISWSRDNEECNHPFHHDCLMKWLLQHNDCPICRQPIVCDEFDRVKELLKRHASNDDNDGRSSSNNNDPIIGKGDVETGNSTNGSSDDAIFIWCVIHGPLLLHDKSSSSRPKITGSHGDDPLSTTVAPHVVCHTKIRDQPSLGECIYRLEALEHGEIDKQ